jgi:hypothetical protein
LGNRGYVKVSGIVRDIKLDDLTRDQFNFDQNLVGWGVDLSSNLKFAKDVLRLQYVFGDGVENYMNDAPIDVAPITNFGDPTRPVKGKLLPLRSWVAYLDHTWTDKLTSSIGYSELAIDNTNLQRPIDFHRGQYGSANLLITPAEHIMYGGELQWARGTNFGDGFHSNDYRI